MTDNTQTDGDTQQLTQEELDARMDQGPSRLDTLKAKAATLGITHSPNIGEDTLAKKIEEFQAAADDEGDNTPPEQQATPPQHAAPAAAGGPAAQPAASEQKAPPKEVIIKMTNAEIAQYPKHLRARMLRVQQRHQHMSMVRCQIFNNNPAKNELKGEIISVTNKYVGTVRKFIPFGEQTEGGYHIPKILFDVLKHKRYQRVKSIKNPDGTERVEKILAPEFTLHVLPPLTKDELAKLAASQKARNASVGFIGA